MQRLEHTGLLVKESGIGQGERGENISKKSTMGILFMHDDIVEPGASIGEHLHQTEEEIYFVVEGQGAMDLDGKKIPIAPGDVSLVVPCHTYGLINSDESPMRVIVVCARKQ